MKILLPVDTSDCCKNTITWAKNFLDKSETEIYLLNVLRFSAHIPDVPMLGYEYDAEIAGSLLREIKEDLLNEGFNVVKAEFMHGDSAKTICGYADEQDIDQIVMGAHGHNPIQEFFIGSVGREVFKKAKQPVLLVNNAQSETVERSQTETLKNVSV